MGVLIDNLQGIIDSPATPLWILLIIGAGAVWYEIQKFLGPNRR